MKWTLVALLLWATPAPAAVIELHAELSPRMPGADLIPAYARFVFDETRATLVTAGTVVNDAGPDWLSNDLFLVPLDAISEAVAVVGNASFDTLSPRDLGNRFPAYGLALTDLINPQGINFQFSDGNFGVSSFTSGDNLLQLNESAHYLAENGLYRGSYTLTASSAPVAAVAEPAAWGPILAGFAGIGWALRRRRL